MEEKLIKKLMTSIKCESCGQNYESYNVDVLGHREDMWFLRVLCSKCQTQCLVAAVVKEGKAPEEVDDLDSPTILEKNISFVTPEFASTKNEMRRFSPKNHYWALHLIELSLIC